jgi:hypothetical protein
VNCKSNHSSPTRLTIAAGFARIGTSKQTHRGDLEMSYKYSETAGYYGNGGWVCFTVDGISGAKMVYKVFATEEEAASYCGVKIGAKQ